MTAYVALLRGINVNGITITMSSLRDLFRGLGFAGVQTVLASGNVLFETGPGESDASALKARIEAALSEAYDYEAWIVLQGVETLGRIVDAYPFDPNREGWHPYVVFSSDPSALTELLAGADGLDPGDERVTAGDGVLYWEVRRAVGVKSPFSKLSGKTRYRSSTTTRNLRTLHKLIA
ncbi:Uncharacterized conserved protein, DUF1697 family [Cryobacterium psychrotolerans]|uniref:Uncharacterized conserved protein, DUF1697 family n=1 Tax=Cryobacterium psychrotolerans TaxID=386301 RepID=A0A1G8ZXH4_9MICO|nr:DUF1697 domain-containing protein [Cryobacterium psychrotolerans]TFD87407.1 DUF1697 domain-containing protein [Cryobacterium psychrotolerans]SDK19816.1 Uncharacterized conserved protein, DUF1697 family [Cryobacterium psychrotolerans]